MGTSTPWGVAQTSEKIAPGIYRYTTAGHGGYHLSRKRYEELPEPLRACSFTGDEWFEEDASWSAVEAFFSQYFTLYQVRSAFKTLRMYYPEALDAWLASDSSVRIPPEPKWITCLCHDGAFHLLPLGGGDCEYLATVYPSPGEYSGKYTASIHHDRKVTGFADGHIAMHFVEKELGI